MQGKISAKNFSTLLSTGFLSGTTQSDMVDSPTGPSFQMKNAKRFIRRSTYLPFIVVGIIVAIVIIFSITNMASKSSTSVSAQSSSNSDGRFDIKKPLASQTLNKQFEFSLKDENGKEVSKLKYIIQEVEKRDEIIVKGERASAVTGRVFLVLNLKIINNYDKTVNVNARDYLRLIINNSSEKLAPDIHNDPVEVQAISTKYTRVAFPINENDNNLVLQVGEIAGSKQQIKLNLR